MGNSKERASKGAYSDVDSDTYNTLTTKKLCKDVTWQHM